MQNQGQREETLLAYGPCDAGQFVEQHIPGVGNFGRHVEDDALRELGGRDLRR